MLLKNLTKRERYISIAAFTVASVAILYNFILEPLLGQSFSADNELASKIAVLKKDSNMLTEAKAREVEYAALASRAICKKSEEEAAADLLSYIENVSRNDSCFVINIKPQGVKKFASHKELLIDLTAEADIGQFSKFLYDIENSKDMILRVKRFTLNSKSSQAGVLRGTFLISKLSLN